jgi:hypothetical protein
MLDPDIALLMADSRLALAREYRVPLAGARSGRLELARGAVQLTIVGDASADHLVEARFGSLMADVQVEPSLVRVVYHRHGGMQEDTRYAGRISLNQAVPWTLACLGGLHRLHADLTAVSIDALDMKGGVSQVELNLGRPAGVVPVTIWGGVHHLVLKRPPEVPIRLTLHGGAANVAFDQQRVDAVGGGLVLASTGFDEAAAKYDVSVTGGTSGLFIDTA